MAKNTTALSPAPNDPLSQGVRERLLEVAARHFADHGIQGASQRAIQREVGVNNSTANYYFGSKDALYRAVVEVALGRIQSYRLAGLKALPPDLSLHDRVRRLLTAYLGALLKEGGTETGYNHIRILVHLHLIVPEPAVKVVSERLHPVREMYLDTLSKLFPNASRNRITEVLELAVGLTAVAAVRHGQSCLSASAIDEITDRVVTVSTIAFTTLCGDG